MYSETFTYRGKNLNAAGTRMVLQRKLRDDLTATLDCSYGADYIQLWHGDANLLRESLEAVQQTAAVIVGAVAPKPEQTYPESDTSNSLSDSVPYSPPPSVESAAESVPF